MRCSPERENIDAAIGLIRGDVDGHGDGRSVVMPRHPVVTGAGLDGGDDLAGNAFVDVGRGRVAAIRGHGCLLQLALFVEGEAAGADAGGRPVTPCSRCWCGTGLMGLAASATPSPASTGELKEGQTKIGARNEAVGTMRGS